LPILPPASALSTPPRETTTQSSSSCRSFENICRVPALYHRIEPTIEKLSSGVECVRLDYQDVFKTTWDEQMRELSKGAKNKDDSKKFWARGKGKEMEIRLYDLMVAAAKAKIQRYSDEISKLATGKEAHDKVKPLEVLKNEDEKAKKTLVDEMMTIERKTYELLDACGSCAKCEKCEKEGAKPSDEFLRKKMEGLIGGKDTWNDRSEKEI
jgi:hypothetical protein